MFRSIRDKEVMIRKNMGRHYIDAAKYFLFNIVFSAVVLSVVIGWIGSFFVNPIAGVLLTFVMLPVMLILVVFNGLVHDFVLQKVIETKSGFIDSISEVLSIARNEWKEVGVYLLVRLFISYAVGLMTVIAAGTVSVLYLIVFGLLAVLLGMVASPLSLIPAFIGLILWLITLLYVTVPFKTYLYSYFVEVYNGVFV